MDGLQRGRVYIAGPYTHPDPIENTHNAVVAWDALTRAGYVAYVPHNTLMLHLMFPRPPEFWYAYDMDLLRLCDYVVRLPGESFGADKECEEAIRLGIPVVTMDALLDSE